MLLTHKKVLRELVLLFLMGLLWQPDTARAQEKPLWELGIGGGFLLMPDYRGSDETRAYASPFPYAVYRGGILRVEDDRISGRIFTNDRVTLDASLYGTVPVRSDENEAREGMPDLDPTFEVGPALRIKLLNSIEHQYNLNIMLPLRAVFSTNFRSMRYEGLIFSSRLNFEMEEVIPDTGIYLWLSAGPMFADYSFHKYFYEVSPEYATTNRQAYSPRAGYSGSTFMIGMGKKCQQIIFHAFVSADFLHGSAFEDSPLVKTKTSWMGGCSISWVFLKSKEMVKTEK